MRLIFLSLCTLLSVQPSLAQGELRLGFMVGLNSSTLDLAYRDSEPRLETNSRLGFIASGFAEIKLRDGISVATEGSYARRGYSYPIRFGPLIEPIDDRITTSMDIISLSVVGRLFPVGHRAFSSYALAGTRMDVLAGSEPGRIAIPSLGYHEDELPTLFSKISLSGAVGLGGAVRLGDWAEFRLEIRYGRTLTDFLSEARVDGSMTGFEILVGFAWQLSNALHRFVP